LIDFRDQVLLEYEKRVYNNLKLSNTIPIQEYEILPGFFRDTDYSYDEIYSRLVEGTMYKGDVLVGISTSGNSGNIVKAFEMAKSMGIVTIGFTGAMGGKMSELSDVLINVPSTDTPRIQESHILIGHIICELVEAQLFA
jgi:DNA-binding MurR/RpiR family transcriptional regulator